MNAHPPPGPAAGNSPETSVGRIGRYRLAQRIGAGSFATVFRGHDDELDVPVAVKVLNPEWAANEEVRRRFITEARYLRRIRDERVVRVYDIGTTPDGRPYFVMDYADGGSFEQLRRQPVQPGRALRLSAEAARALAVLHRHHVLHRDVTPGNLLLHHSPAGLRVLLADLGVAEAMADQKRVVSTAGTPAFMPLEQASGQPIDQRADIYAMAAVTYALLTGHAPFRTKNVNDLLNRDPQAIPPPIAHHIGAPAALDTLMRDALSPYPERRPASAEVFASALDAIAATMPGGDTFTPQPMPATSSSFMMTESDAEARVLERPAPAPSRETPISMLEGYLGPGRYRPEPVPERQPLKFYLVIVAGAVTLFALVALVTVLWLSR